MRALGVSKVRAGPWAGPELLGYSEEAGHHRAVSALVERQDKNLELIEVKELFVMPDGAVGGSICHTSAGNSSRGNRYSLHSETSGLGAVGSKRPRVQFDILLRPPAEDPRRGATAE